MISTHIGDSVEANATGNSAVITVSKNAHRIARPPDSAPAKRFLSSLGAEACTNPYAITHKAKKAPTWLNGHLSTSYKYTGKPTTNQTSLAPNKKNRALASQLIEGICEKT